MGNMKLKRILSVFMITALTFSVTAPQTRIYDAAEVTEFNVALEVTKNAELYANNLGVLESDVEFDLAINLRNIPKASKETITIPGTSKQMELSIPEGLNAVQFGVAVKYDGKITDVVTFDTDGDGNLDYEEGKLSDNGAFEKEVSYGLEYKGVDSCLIVSDLDDSSGNDCTNILWTTGLLEEDSDYYLHNNGSDLLVTLHGVIEAGSAIGDYSFEVVPINQTVTVTTGGRNTRKKIDITDFTTLVEYTYSDSSGPKETYYAKVYKPTTIAGTLSILSEKAKTTTTATTTSTSTSTSKSATTTSTSKSGTTTSTSKSGTTTSTSKSGTTTSTSKGETTTSTSKSGITTTGSITTTTASGKDPEITTTAPYVYEPYDVTLPPVVVFANPNIAGQGSAESIPDGKYYQDGKLVADKLDIDANGNKVYSLNNVPLVDADGTPIAIEFNSFENNAPDLIDLLAILNIALSGADPTNYAVYSDEFFKKDSQYCDEGTFALTGTRNPNTTLGITDVVYFLKYFGAPSRAVVISDLLNKADVYAAQLNDDSSENFKSYVEILGILKEEFVSEENASKRTENALAKLQEYADAEENHDVNVNYLLTANPDTL
jgi:hypothetical protein